MYGIVTSRNISVYNKKAFFLSSNMDNNKPEIFSESFDVPVVIWLIAAGVFSAVAIFSSLMCWLTRKSEKHQTNYMKMP